MTNHSQEFTTALRHYGLGTSDDFENSAVCVIYNHGPATWRGRPGANSAAAADPYRATAALPTAAVISTEFSAAQVHRRSSLLFADRGAPSTAEGRSSEGCGIQNDMLLRSLHYCTVVASYIL